MKLNTVKKWSLRIGGVIISLIILAILAGYILFTQAIDRVYGGKTPVVDPGQFQVDAGPTAITNVSVLSPDGTDMLASRTVLLKDEVILSITPNGDVPDGMLTIDGQGKFLIPGLIDSHVHLQRSPNDLLLYVANGVTQIRTMGGAESDLILKQEIENGRVGPHFYVSSTAMSSKSVLMTMLPSVLRGPLGVWFAETAFNMHLTPSAERAAEDARSFIEEGHDGLKLYGFLDMDSFRAILDVAEQLDVPTVGHLPDDMLLSELHATKLQEIGHLEEIVKALLNEFGSFKDQGGVAFLAFVESRKEEIVSDLVANDIAVHSTLRFSENFKRMVFDIGAVIAESPVEYANPGIVEGYAITENGWLPEDNKFQSFAGGTPEEIALNKEFWTVREEAHHILFEEMIEDGVTILAATDANGWFSVPGFSLHDDLQSLSQAGMSPAQSLYAATAAPAKRINNNAGVIQVGRRADLVLLNSNPLIDIENTTSIDTVVVGGRVYNRGQLDEMLDAVKTANAASRKFNLSLYQ